MVEVSGGVFAGNLSMFGLVGLPGGTVLGLSFPSENPAVSFSWSAPGAPLLGDRQASGMFGHSLVHLGVLEPPGLPTLAIGDPGYEGGTGAVFLITMQDCEWRGDCEPGGARGAGADHIHRIVRLSSLDDTIRRAPGGTAIPEGRIGFGAAIAVIPFPGEHFDGPDPSKSQPPLRLIAGFQLSTCIAVAAPEAGDNGEIYLLYLGVRGLVLSVAVLDFPSTTPAGLAFRPLVLTTVKEFPSAFRGWAEPSDVYSLTMQLLIPQWDATGRVYLLHLRSAVVFDDDIIRGLGLQNNVFAPTSGIVGVRFAEDGEAPLPSAVTLTKPHIAVLEGLPSYRGGWGLSVSLGNWSWARLPAVESQLGLTDLDSALPLLYVSVDLEGGNGRGGIGSTLTLVEAYAVLRHTRSMQRLPGGYLQKAIDVVGVADLTGPVVGNAAGGVLAAAPLNLEGMTRLFVASELNGRGWRAGLVKVKRASTSNSYTCICFVDVSVTLFLLSFCSPSLCSCHPQFPMPSALAVNGPLPWLPMALVWMPSPVPSS